MLLYQEASYNWVGEGINLLQKYPEIMYVTPLAGPPTKDGSLRQKHHYQRDPRGFYKFKVFTNRVYLMNLERYESLLPIKVLLYFPRYKFLNYLPQRAKTI